MLTTNNPRQGLLVVVSSTNIKSSSKYFYFPWRGKIEVTSAKVKNSSNSCNPCEGLQVVLYTSRNF